MKTVTGNRINLTRGDTCRVQLTLYTSEGELYTPTEGDVIRFAAKKAYEDPVPLIYIVIPNDTLILEIKPTHTKNLAFGAYVYDIQLTCADGTVDTFITKGILKIEEEVD